MKVRSFPEHNYRAIWNNNQTLRLRIDPNKPITRLKYPELLDCSFGDKCVTGRCKFCYASGNPKGRHYPNIVKKIRDYFGPLTQNQRPFQVAIGGQQEPLEHPEFWDGVMEFRSLDIVPNYTTNGVLFNDEVAKLTLEHYGGVAITLHPHLEKHWRRALKVCRNHGLKPNIHFIISDSQSVDRCAELYSELRHDVDYFVLLPYMNVGFAARNPKNICLPKLETWVNSVYQEGKIAFGANFYEWLKDKPWGTSLYEPEIVSGYLVFDDPVRLYNNSFQMIPV